MCGRFSLKAQPDDLRKTCDAGVPPVYRPRFNIAPSQEVLSLTLGEDGTRRLRFFRWGLVPFWADDPRIGSRMINARAETVADKPAFRAAFRSRRCLVCADGFYEWAAAPTGKQPMRIHRPDDLPFLFAALWERWDRGGTPLESCTILTTAASDRLRPIHDRMPVILDPDGAATWLEAESPAAVLRELIARPVAAPLEAYPVSTLVNSPSNDLPACLDRWEGG
jgi:putative SOS response-associated peptidase YedK